MKFKIENHLPTEGMLVMPKGRNTTENQMHLWVDRLTTYYDDMGQLHWGKGRGVKTWPLYFIQAVDLEISMVIGMGDASMSKLALPYLDSNIKNDVIRCAVPVEHAGKYTNNENGIRYFLSQHHPDPEIREANFDQRLALA